MCVLIFFLLGFEIRTSHLLGRCSATGACSWHACVHGIKFSVKDL
jgi:hypothetical protein